MILYLMSRSSHPGKKYTEITYNMYVYITIMFKEFFKINRD